MRPSDRGGIILEDFRDQHYARVATLMADTPEARDHIRHQKATANSQLMSDVGRYARQEGISHLRAMGEVMLADNPVELVSPDNDERQKLELEVEIEPEYTDAIVYGLMLIAALGPIRATALRVRPTVAVQMLADITTLSISVSQTSPVDDLA